MADQTSNITVTLAGQDVGLEATLKNADALVKQITDSIAAKAANISNSANGIGKSFGNVGATATAAEGQANKLFQGVSNVGDLLVKAGKQAVQFSSSFLGFQIINVALQGFNSATIGSVTAAANFESSLEKVSKTTDLTGSQLTQLGDNFRQISRDLPLTTQSLLDIAEAAGKVGVSGVQNITNFSETIDKLSKVTDLNGPSAALTLGQFETVTGTPQSQTSNIASTITDLGNKFASSETAISDFSLRLAASGKLIGLSTPQIIGFANALTSLGVSSEQGGTAFSRVFDVVSSVAKSGGKSLEDFAKVAGVTTDQFKQLIATNPAQGIVQIFNGLKAIQDSGQDVIPVLTQLGLGNIRTRDTLLRAADAAGTFSASLQDASTAFRDNVALNAAFDRQTETSASKAQVLSNNLKDIQISLGKAFLPVGAGGSQTIANFLQGVTGSSKGISQTGDELHNIFSLLGIVASGIDKLVGSVVNLTSSFGGANIVLKTTIDLLAAYIALQVSQGTLQAIQPILNNATVATKNQLFAQGVVQNLTTSDNRVVTLPGSFSLPSSQIDNLTRQTITGRTIPSGSNLVSEPILTSRNTVNSSDVAFAQLLENPFLGPNNAPKTPGQFISSQEVEHLTSNLKDFDKAAVQAQIDSGKLIPSETLNSIPKMASELGATTVAASAFKGILSSIGGFLAANPILVGIVGITVAITALNAILEHFTGGGIIDVFTHASATAKQFQQDQDNLNKSIDEFNRLISAGSLTAPQAGQLGITQVGQTTEETSQKLAALNKSAPSVTGSLLRAGSGALRAPIDIATFNPAVVGDIASVGSNLFGLVKTENQKAAFQKQLKDQEDSLYQYARTYNQTIDQLNDQKVQLSVGLKGDQLKNLQKTFDDTIQKIGSEDLSGLEINLKEAGKPLDDLSKTDLGNLTNQLDKASQSGKSLSSIKFDNSSLKDTVSTIEDVLNTVTYTDTSVKVLKQDFKDSFPAGQAQAYSDILDEVYKNQQKVLSDLKQSKPELFTELNKDVTGLSKLTPDAISKIKSEISQLNTSGSPLIGNATSDLAGQIPQSALDSLNSFFNIIKTDGPYSQDQLSQIGLYIDSITKNSPDLGDALKNAFLNANTEAQIFIDSIDNIDKISKTVDFSKIFTFDKGFQQNDIDKAVADLQDSLNQHLGGVANSKLLKLDPLHLQAQGENALNADITSFGKVETLISQSDIDRLAVKNGTAYATQFSTSVNETIDRIGESIDLTKFDKVQTSIDLSELESFIADRKIGANVQLVLDNAQKQFDDFANGIGSKPIIATIEINISLADVQDQLKNTTEGFATKIANIDRDVQNIAKASKGGVTTNTSYLQDLGSGLQQELATPPGTIGGNLPSNNGGAAAANKQLTALDQNLLDVAKAMKDLNLTAQQFTEINSFTGLTGKQLDDLAGVFKNLGIQASDLIPLMEKVNFDKIAKQLGASDQAIANGSALQFFQKIAPGILSDPEKLKELEALIQALGGTGVGNSPSGLQNLEKISAGGQIGNGAVSGGNDLASLSKLGGSYDDILRAIAAKNPNALTNEQLHEIHWPGYAMGGVINTPTIAMIGEAGPEMVLPLSKPSRMGELLGSVGVKMADGGIVAPNGIIPGVNKYHFSDTENTAVSNGNTSTLNINAPISITSPENSVAIAQETRNRLMRVSGRREKAFF